jgi:hypothetical protein
MVHDQWSAHFFLVNFGRLLLLIGFMTRITLLPALSGLELWTEQLQRNGDCRLKRSSGIPSKLRFRAHDSNRTGARVSTDHEVSEMVEWPRSPRRHELSFPEQQPRV